MYLFDNISIGVWDVTTLYLKLSGLHMMYIMFLCFIEQMAVN